MLHEKIETQTNAKSKECNVKNEKSAKWKKYKKTYKKSNIEKSAQEQYITVHKWITARPGRTVTH